MSAPLERRHVTFEAPGGERLAARVERVGPGFVEIGLFFRPGRPLRPGRGAVEYTSDRGLYRLSGAVVEPGSDGLLRLEVGGDPELHQRRDHVRVDAMRPLRVSDSHARALDTFTVNVSGGGLLIAGPEDLELGEEVEFTLRLDSEGSAVRGRGVVVRETDRGMKGVEIAAIDGQAREQLIRFVFDRQREARRRASGRFEE